MSQPLPAGSFAVDPGAVAALADELHSLAAELAEEAERSRATATSFPVALGGDEGWTASCAATAWASLQRVLADRTRAVAGTLDAAVAAYRTEDDALAGRIHPGDRDAGRGPR